MTSTNQYKNILGIYPKDWRVPLTFRRNNTERYEVLVRLMGNMANRARTGTDAWLSTRAGSADRRPRLLPPRGTAQPPSSTSRRRAMPTGTSMSSNATDCSASSASTANFAAVGGAWVADGKYVKGDQPGDFRLEVSDGKDGADSIVNLDLNIKYSLSPLKQTDPSLQREPIGSGGLMMALYHYRRLLTMGAKGFEAEFASRRLRAVLSLPDRWLGSEVARGAACGL